MIEIALREKKQGILINRQDSVIMHYKTQLGLCDEQIFILQQKYNLCVDASKSLNNSLSGIITEKNELKSSNEKLQTKLKRQKRLKWIFACGAAIITETIRFTIKKGL